MSLLAEWEIERIAQMVAVNQMGAPIPVEKAEFATGYAIRHDDDPETIDTIQKRARRILDNHIEILQKSGTV